MVNMFVSDKHIESVIFKDSKKRIISPLRDDENDF